MSLAEYLRQVQDDTRDPHEPNDTQPERTTALHRMRSDTRIRETLHCSMLHSLGENRDNDVGVLPSIATVCQACAEKSRQEGPSHPSSPVTTAEHDRSYNLSKVCPLRA